MATKASGGTVTWTLDGDSKPLEATLTKAQSGAKRTAQEFEKAGNAVKGSADKMGTSFGMNLDKIQGKIGGITSGMQNFALKVAGLTAVVGGLGVASLKTFASFEDIEANLFAITGSSDEASKALKELQSISMDTKGFSTKGLSEVTLSLKNVYGSTDEAIKQTRTFATILTATGRGEQHLSSIVSALEMIKVSGKAGTRQMRAFFANNPLFAEMAAKVGLTADALEEAEDPLKLLTQMMEQGLKDPKILESVERQNNTLTGLWEDMSENFTNQLVEWVRGSGLVEIAKKAMEDFIVWLKANGPQIGETLKNAFSWIIDNRQKIVGAVIAFGAVWAGLKIASAIITLYKLTVALRGLWLVLKGFAIVNAIVGFLTTNIGSLAGVGRVLMAVLTGLTSVVGLVIAAIGIWAWNIYQIATHWQDFRDLIVAGIAWLGQVATAIYNVGISIVQGLANGIIAAGQMVWDGIKGAADKIGEFFSGAANWLYDTGKNIIQGLINGIKDMAGAVKDSVGNIGSGIKNKFKSVLGIASPSKVFAQYGENIGQGLSQGIGDTIGQVSGSVSVMANDLQQPMATASPLATPQTSPVQSGNTITNNIGTINIAKEVDGEKWLQKLNRNTELAGNGMVGVTNV